MKLCFATNNLNKVREIAQLLGSSIELLSLKDINCLEEIREDQQTLEGNAAQKAQYVYEHYHVNCFADDTGLEVDALNNQPGVYSARYAGLQRSDGDNMALLLENLKGETNRNARFRTVICLIIDGQQHSFEGIAKGKIAVNHSGDKGFGYDPIFIPEGENRTFAQMAMDEKNKISHRGKAVNQLVDFLAK